LIVGVVDMLDRPFGLSLPEVLPIGKAGR